MENAEEIMHSLEEFSKMKPKDIPHELDDYLGYVARTGDPVFKWSIIKCLFREKLLNVITDFYESTLTIELPPCPNVDPFNYERMKANLLEKLDSFHGAPFTVQRISELLTNPRKEYNRADKFMRAIEKNILVVSTREPGREADAESYNGMPDANDSGVEAGFPCNDFSDPDSTAQSYEAKVEQAESAYQVTGAAEGSSTMTDEGPSAPEAQEIHDLPTAGVEEKDTESVICSTSVSEQPHSSEPTEHLTPASSESIETRQETAVASTSEASYELGNSHVEPSPSTSTAEPAGYPEEAAVFPESPVEPTSHPVEGSLKAQMDTHESLPTAPPSEEVSTSDVGSTEEAGAPEIVAEEETTAEAVPLATEAPEADLQCAETVGFEDDRPTQSESATSQSDSVANQSDFLSQSESSGSDSNPSGEEPMPSEPEPVPAQVQELTPEQEQVEAKVYSETEPPVTTGPAASESSSDAPTNADVQPKPCEEPQPSEPTKDHPEPEPTPRLEGEPGKSETEAEPKPTTECGDQSRETSVIQMTSSDVDEPMEVDECQAPEQTPLPW